MTPAVDALLADGARRHRSGRDRTRRPPTWDNVVAPLADRARPPRSRVGRRAPSERGRQHAGAARRVQRQPAERHGVPHRPRRRTCACSRATARSRDAPAFATLDAARRKVDRERAARFPARRRRAARRGQGALQGRAGRARASSRRSSTTTCSTPPMRGRSTSTTKRELAGVPADVVAAARAAAQADGKPGWKLTLRMPCYLPVMQYADNRALRATLHRGVRDARVRARRIAGVGQHAGHRAHPRAAPRGRAAARLSELRRTVAGAEDGAARRRSARLPARSRAPREALRRARLRRAARVRARPSSASPISRRGTSPTLPKNSRRERYAFSEQEVQAIFPGRQGARRAVPCRRDALRRDDPRGEGARRGIRACASSSIRDATAR